MVGRATSHCLNCNTFSTRLVNLIIILNSPVRRLTYSTKCSCHFWHVSAAKRLTGWLTRVRRAFDRRTSSTRIFDQFQGKKKKKVIKRKYAWTEEDQRMMEKLFLFNEMNINDEQMAARDSSILAKRPNLDQTFHFQGNWTMSIKL